LGWWRGSAVMRLIHSTKLTNSGRVSTAMGDCLQAGKPSQYVTSRLDHLSLPSLRSR